MVHLVVMEDVVAGPFTKDVLDSCHASLVHIPALVILKIRHTLGPSRINTAAIGTCQLLRETSLLVHFVSWPKLHFKKLLRSGHWSGTWWEPTILRCATSTRASWRVHYCSWTKTSLFPILPVSKKLFKSCFRIVLTHKLLSFKSKWNTKDY